MLSTIKKYVISFLICGLILDINYLIAGIIGKCVNEGQSKAMAIGTVLASPFGNYFNEFTPVMLVLGFVIFETLWCLFIFLRSKKAVTEKAGAAVSNDSTKSDINIVQTTEEAKVNKESNIAVPTIEDSEKRGKIQDIDITEFGFVIPPDLEKTNQEDTDKKEKDDMALNLAEDTSGLTSADPEEDINSFSSDIFWELNGDYSSEQIREMVKLKQYIGNLDAGILRKTFKSSLSPVEIREYIELFYG